ncbi:MAG: tRNA (guanosine(46)-N7)-methyltransferase TrmB [Alphaproteobacteria bacterium]
MTPAAIERQRIPSGSRRGRPLRPGQRALLGELLPRLAIAPPAAGERLDPGALFAEPKRDVWLEIGFGSGEHLAWQARARPDVGMIGCEFFVNGVARLLAHVRDDGLANLRVFVDDARLLLEALPEASIGRAFLLFPDPWPKKRHHKRRFISPETLELLAAALEDGAELRLASDDGPYVRWILERTLTHAAFDWLAETAQDWRERPGDWPETRYEAKARRCGRACYYLRFRRRSRRPCGSRRPTAAATAAALEKGARAHVTAAEKTP